jgi:hypothetical protein
MEVRGTEFFGLTQHRAAIWHASADTAELRPEPLACTTARGRPLPVGRRVGVARRPPCVNRRRLSNQRHVLCLAKNVPFPSHRTRGTSRERGRRGPTHMAVPLKNGGREPAIPIRIRGEQRAPLPLRHWLHLQRFWCSPPPQQSSHQPSCLPTDTSWERSAQNMCFVLTQVVQSQAPMVHLHLGWSCIS